MSGPRGPWLAGLVLGAAFWSGGTAAAATFPGRNGPIAFTITRDTRQDPQGQDCSTASCEDSRTYLLDVSRRKVRQAGLCLGETDCQDTFPEFDPRGRRLLVRRDYVANDPASKPSLTIGPAFAPGPRISFLPAAEGPVWAPDGKRVLVASSSDTRTPEDLYVIDPVTGGSTRLTKGGAASPDWSPTGAIAFSRRTNRVRPGSSRARADIFTIRQGARRARRLTFDGLAGSPRWSPHGRQIAYLQGRIRNGKKTFAIYMMTADGARKGRVVGAWAEPTWAPDGRWIAYVSKSSIYRVRPDGSDRERLYALRRGTDSARLSGLTWGVRAR